MSSQAIAEAFAKTLRAWLSKEELQQVKARNAEGRRIGANWCASHDFCDANLAMLEGFEQAMKREPDLEDDGDHALINAAWTIAKAADFWLEKYDTEWAGWADDMTAPTKETIQ